VDRVVALEDISAAIEAAVHAASCRA
jgi:hypothetical protein